MIHFYCSDKVAINWHARAKEITRTRGVVGANKLLSLQTNLKTKHVA